MTIKEYYKNPFLLSCKGRVVDKTEEGIILDRTVAFPEGGGQAGDRGSITVEGTGEVIGFFYTTKTGGERAQLEDFPSINLGTTIVHHVSPEEMGRVSVGDSVTIQVDEERRAKTTINHSGIHVVIGVLEEMGIQHTRNIYGAKITHEYARIDFRMEEKFTQEQLKAVKERVDEIVREDHPIEIYAHEKHSEALYWRCLGYTCPCGGTHLLSTGSLGPVTLKRKTVGREGDRIIAKFLDPVLPEYVKPE